MPNPLRRPLVAGNWKMHGLRASAGELAAIIAGAPQVAAADLLICPPATLICQFAAMARASRVRIGGQDCHPQIQGAFTGDISAEMLKDAGAEAVIVGHSERRQFHGETDQQICAKAQAALHAGLLAIVCVGETQAERDAGLATQVVGRQLEASLPEQTTADNLVVAYEPVWAIGTGRTPTAADIAQVHGFIRERLIRRLGSPSGRTRILYGGSVKATNAKEIFGVADVDGALVGGASLKAEEFLAIARAYR